MNKRSVPLSMQMVEKELRRDEKASLTCWKASIICSLNKIARMTLNEFRVLDEMEQIEAVWNGVFNGNLPVTNKHQQ